MYVSKVSSIGDWWRNRGLSFLVLFRFYFASGGGKNGFVNYYKRRISRIYPSVFAAVVFVALYNGKYSICFQELLGGEFIVAIMLYYILLYIIREYAINRLGWILGFVAFFSYIVYLFWFPNKYEISSRGIYGIATLYRWIPYFAAMLIGAIVGRRRMELKYHAWWDFVKLMVCLTVFYGIQFGAKMYKPIAPWQIVTLFPLMGITIYFYKCCHASWLTNLYQTRYGNWVIMFIGGLCLESYLIQLPLFTDKMNDIFPLNLIIIVVVILACSYLVRCIARIFQQTFQTEDYDWEKVFRMV